MHIKTSSSASLPIWNCRLDEEEGGRWDGLTRVPIPDDTNEGVKKGKKRALEPEEETAKKKKSGSITKKSTSFSQTPRPDASLTGFNPSKSTLPAASIKSIKATKERLPKQPTSKGIIETKEKPTRAAAVDFFDTENPEDRPSSSKPSARTTTTSRKSTEPSPSPSSEPPTAKKLKTQGEKHSGTKTILKTSKTIAESSTVDVPTKEKRVKFAVKLSDSKTKKDKALGLIGKKVRSGGGKGASVKDRVLGKKVVVR
jgi:ribosome biogenesis protein UTP30